MRWGVHILVVCGGLFGVMPMPEPPSAGVDCAASRGCVVSIVTVFDNYVAARGLVGQWGHASVVKGPDWLVLFDTGSDGRTLLANMKRMNIDPGDIDKVVISHVHGDHLGGLAELLKANSHVVVHIPTSFPESVRKSIEAAGARYVDVGAPTAIGAGVHSTGPMGDGLDEQALIVDTREGVVVMTGCAHPGIVRVVEKAKSQFAGRPVALVMGGFHLLSASDAEIDRIVKAFRGLGVRKVAPSHCSGDPARSRFQAEYGPDYVAGGAGRILAFSCPERPAKAN